MVVLGWLITGFWARQDQNFETFPDFDFSHFGKYLERGLVAVSRRLRREHGLHHRHRAVDLGSDHSHDVDRRAFLRA
jgi:hypothetical protein